MFHFICIGLAFKTRSTTINNRCNNLASANQRKHTNRNEGNNINSRPKNDKNTCVCNDVTLI